MTECSVTDCNRTQDAKGFCPKHYRRWRKHGDPLFVDGTERGEVPIYFQSVVLQYEGNDCLFWPYAKNRKGYPQINEGGKTRIVPRLICEETHGRPPTKKHQAAHSCGKGHLGCVTKRHLRWATPSENQRDRVEHGTDSRGERHRSAKLSRDQVLEIRTKIQVLSKGVIAVEYGVHPDTVTAIAQRKSWAWLPEGGAA